MRHSRFAAIMLAFSAARADTFGVPDNFDPDDYALVVKLRDAQPNPWHWETHSPASADRTLAKLLCLARLGADRRQAGAPATAVQPQRLRR
jgi:hypothetical protein